MNNCCLCISAVYGVLGSGYGWSGRFGHCTRTYGLQRPWFGFGLCIKSHLATGFCCILVILLNKQHVSPLTRPMATHSAADPMLLCFLFCLKCAPVASQRAWLIAAIPILWNNAVTLLFNNFSQSSHMMEVFGASSTTCSGVLLHRSCLLLLQSSLGC
jgi:hypothetical protein